MVPFFAKCFISEACLIIFGLFLRCKIDMAMGGEFCWKTERAIMYESLRKQNGFLWSVMYVERIIGNVSIAGFLIGIPIYFLFGV